MGRLSLAKGEGEDEDCVKAINAAARQSQPLIFILPRELILILID
jgi:hypothetical protein